MISYKFFVEKSLLNISEILDYINPKLINKILYTSSSSVYGSIGGKIDFLIKITDLFTLLSKLQLKIYLKTFVLKTKLILIFVGFLIFMDLTIIFPLYLN